MMILNVQDPYAHLCLRLNQLELLLYPVTFRVDEEQASIGQYEESTLSAPYC